MQRLWQSTDYRAAHENAMSRGTAEIAHASNLAVVYTGGDIKSDTDPRPPRCERHSLSYMTNGGNEGVPCSRSVRHAMRRNESVHRNAIAG
eukprot:scaffold234166_cov31-Tisochrysis_lutea.AAC.3